MVRHESKSGSIYIMVIRASTREAVFQKVLKHHGQATPLRKKSNVIQLSPHFLQDRKKTKVTELVPEGEPGFVWVYVHSDERHYS